MKLLKFFFIAAFATISCGEVSAQGEVPVDMFTGTPVINIPIWTVQDHDLSVPISLNYNTSGLKLEQRATFIGIGWTVVGGGSVTREVRGLPDDFDGVDTGTTKYDPRRGWLHTRTGVSTKLAREVGTFTTSSDASASTCTDESSDHAKLLAFSKFFDTEPDIFYFSAPGLSGSFLFDNSATPAIRCLSVQDLRITYTTNPTTNDIIAFTIKTPDGVTYNFATAEIEEESTRATSTAPVEFLKNEFSLWDYDIENVAAVYKNVKFHRQWMLSSMVSSTGANITFSYTARDFSFTRPMNVGIRKPTLAGMNTVTPFTIASGMSHQVLNAITSSTGEKVTFDYPDYGMDDPNSIEDVIQSIVVTDERESDPFVKEFLLHHKEIGTTSYERPFLESITERSYCNELPPYKFSYIGVDFAAGTSQLPEHSSTAKDFWGYYNGKANLDLYPTLYVYPALSYPDKVRIERISGYSGEEIILPGADRTCDPNLVKVGTLNTITYPTGGALTIEYEPHRYKDPQTSLTKIGGGLRVKSIRQHDGVNPGADVYKEFTYEESAGVSSGRLLSMPVFYLPTQRYVSSSGSTVITFETLSAGPSFDLWDKLLVRTDVDMATPELINGSVVAYNKVKVKRPGSGSAIHVFTLPATYKSGTTGPWSPTENRFARSNSTCQNMGIMNTQGGGRFPFTRNPNFDVERGLLTATYEYNESGQLVKEVTRTYGPIYKNGTAPGKVWGLQIEDFSNTTDAYFFGFYYNLVEYSKVPTSETIKSYRLENNTAMSTVTEFFYESTAHRYMTRSRSINSDGTIYSTKIKYPLDYAYVPGSGDVQSQMLHYMRMNSMNTVPIEVIHTIQKPAEVEKVLAATLTKFTPAPNGFPLAYQTLEFKASVPVTDFTQSQIVGTFPSAFTHDPRYILKQAVKSYDSYLQPVTAEDVLARSMSSVAFGYNKTLPVVQFNDVTLPQVGFSDFETTTDISFVANATVYGSGRTGVNSIHPSVTLTRTITKSNTPEGYVLSYWASTGSTPITIRVVISVSGSQISSNDFTVPATGAGFKQFRNKILVNTASTSFSVSVTGVGFLAPGSYTSSPTLLPVLDDVAFCPEYATFESFTYDIPYGATSQTTANGKTGFIQLDHLGRTTLKLDQEKNIIEKNTYRIGSDKLTSEFFLPSKVDRINSHGIDDPATFIAWEDCHDNVTYTWNFGSGNVVGSKVQTHQFTTTGEKTITLTISAPGLPTVTRTKKLLVYQPNLICARGVKVFNVTTRTRVSSYTCADITTFPPNNTTIFKVEGGIDDGIDLYTWKKRSIGSTVWQTVQTGASDQYSYLITAEDNEGYEVICEGTTNAGTIAKSNVMQVTFIN